MKSVEAVQQDLERSGFVFVSAGDVRPLLAPAALEAWGDFAASWDDLALDAYLLERGLRRRRRHAVFSISRAGAIAREPHQPHWQSREYNALQGGIERWFPPIVPAVADGVVLRGVLELAARIFGPPPGDAWRVEAHQFRIEPRANEPGQPTPEGVHRDGVDWVLVLLVARQNVASGTTTVHAEDGSLLGSFTLTEPLEAALVDDARVAHGVTPVHAIDPAQPAHRDVLVVTFVRASS